MHEEFLTVNFYIYFNFVWNTFLIQILMAGHNYFQVFYQGSYPCEETPQQSQLI